MKICVVTPGPFTSEGGGARILIYDLAKAIARKGHKVSVVSIISEDEEITYTKNIDIHPILKAGRGTIGFLKILLSFYRILKCEKFDIIHAHFAFSGGTIGLVGKLFGLPIVVTSHGGDIQKDEESGSGFRLNKIYAMIIWLTLKLIDSHVVISKSMIKAAIEAGSHLSKIKVIYNGINLNKISSFGQTDILKRYKITEDDFIVLYLGRLIPIKCPQDLVRAFPKVVKKVPNARLIFTGKGEEEMNLKKLVSDLNLNDKVIFAGFVSEDKWDLLKRCDVFVLPSISEGHPIAVIEAMACGKPVIATNVGPFPEIIRDGETGLLVPLHSPDDLADAIIGLAFDEKKRLEMGTKAKEYVTERFSINKTADDYLEIYERLINRKGLRRKKICRIGRNIGSKYE